MFAGRSELVGDGSTKMPVTVTITVEDLDFSDSDREVFDQCQE
jgi:hypothetical protein